MFPPPLIERDSSLTLQESDSLFNPSSQTLMDHQLVCFWEVLTDQSSLVSLVLSVSRSQILSSPRRAST